MPRPRDFLEFHHGSFRVVINVPRKFQAIVGRTKLKRSLGTDSLATANALKHRVIAELRAEIARLTSGAPDDPLTAEANGFRASLAEAAPGEWEDVRYALYERADMLRGPPIGEREGDDGRPEPVYDAASERRAGIFVGIALGTATPITSQVAAWHATARRKERTKADDHRALQTLEGWCRAGHAAPTLEALDRRTAGRFIDEHLVSVLTSPTTVNKYLSSLAAYWKFLVRRGVMEGNVWHGQFLAKQQPPDDERERSFTTEEVARLLTGPARGYLPDLMRIAALTGARIDVITSLKIRDIEGGIFRFPPRKRETSVREVPIHTALVDIIAARRTGKGPDDDLFPELPVPDDPRRTRSDNAGKQFNTYRKSLGIDEVVPGKRGSRVNFHSFRRWFTTEAARAGISPIVLAGVVGHRLPGMTYGVYFGGSTLDQKRECVEAVRLPV